MGPECPVCKDKRGLLDDRKEMNKWGENLSDQVRHMAAAGKMHTCNCKYGEAWRRYAGVLASREQAMHRERESTSQERMERRFANAGVPPKYLEFKFANFATVAETDKDKTMAVFLIKQLVRNGHTDSGKTGLLLWGDSGTGKTGALTPLFVHLMRQGQSGLWIGYADLMAELRDFDSGEVNRRMETCQDVDVLFIDDLFDPAATKISDYARETLFRIIEHRNTHGKTMFFTSNADMRKVEDLGHKRIARRIYDNCEICHLSGIPFDDIPKGLQVNV